MENQRDPHTRPVSSGDNFAGDGPNAEIHSSEQSPHSPPDSRNSHRDTNRATSRLESDAIPFLDVTSPAETSPIPHSSESMSSVGIRDSNGTSNRPTSRLESDAIPYFDVTSPAETSSIPPSSESMSGVGVRDPNGPSNLSISCLESDAIPFLDYTSPKKTSPTPPKSIFGPAVSDSESDDGQCVVFKNPLGEDIIQTKIPTKFDEYETDDPVSPVVSNPSATLDLGDDKNNLQIHDVSKELPLHDQETVSSDNNTSLLVNNERSSVVNEEVIAPVQQSKVSSVPPPRTEQSTSPTVESSLDRSATSGTDIVSNDVVANPMYKQNEDDVDYEVSAEENPNPENVCKTAENRGEGHDDQGALNNNVEDQVCKKAEDQGQVCGKAEVQDQVCEKDEGKGQVSEKAEGQGQVSKKAEGQGQVGEKAEGKDQACEKTEDDGQVCEKSVDQGQVCERAVNQGEVCKKVVDEVQLFKVNQSADHIDISAGGDADHSMRSLITQQDEELLPYESVQHESSVIDRAFSKLKAVICILSLILYLFDIGSDVNLIIKYHRNGDTWWFRFTTILVVVPALVMSSFSAVVYHKLFKKHRDRWTMPWTVFRFSCVVTGLSPIARYVEGLVHGFRGNAEYWVRELREAGMLRLIEGFLEAAPQLVLQFYIITYSQPGYTRNVSLVEIWLSCAFSLASLSIALASYWKVLRDSRPDSAKMSLLHVAIHGIGLLFIIASRVVALALFAHYSKLGIGVVLLAHVVFMLMWYLNGHQGQRYCGGDGSQINLKELGFRFLLSLVGVFVYVNYDNSHTRLRYALYYSVTFVENGVMVLLWYCALTGDGVWYADLLLGVVLAGFVIGVGLQLLYYRCSHPRNRRDDTKERIQGLCSVSFRELVLCNCEHPTANIV